MAEMSLKSKQVTEMDRVLAKSFLSPLTFFERKSKLPVFTPLGLFVVVSWISFVVPPDVIPGRMALLITLFLVLVNIFNTVTTNTPKAEG